MRGWSAGLKKERNERCERRMEGPVTRKKRLRRREDKGDGEKKSTNDLVNSAV